MLTHIDFLNEQIIELDMKVAKRLSPFQKDLDRLDRIPGIAARTAEQILDEIGTDIASVSRVQPIYAHGLVLFQVTMKARANASPPKHVKATNISDPHSSKLLTPYEDLIMISVPNSGELQLPKEGNVQLLLLRTSS